MEIIETASKMQAWRKEVDAVAFVPTMGNLHAGHLALVKRAKATGAQVVVSIFVNPLQFGEDEDLDQYPRTLAQDLAQLGALGVGAVFVPTVEELYPNGLESVQTLVNPPTHLIDDLCGRSRPGHFEGVATVVSKFFNIIQPNYALFGEKDYQQLKVIEQMVEDLNYPIEILSAPIIREESGLARSSRNHYLTPQEKEASTLLYQTLKGVEEKILAGERNYQDLEEEAKAKLAAAGWKVDYLTVRVAENLNVATDEQELILLAAATLGETRLLDNIRITL